MELEFEDEFGGYDIEFVDKLSQCQKCPICLLAMRDPVQTECGHRFCESCLLRSFREGDQVCPQDRNVILDGGGPAFRCDKIVVIVTLLAQMYRWLSCILIRHFEKHKAMKSQDGIQDKDYNFWGNDKFPIFTRDYGTS